jgi:hypothetical protein
MTELVQSVVERLSQLPEPVQHRLAQCFLKEVEAAEAQTGTPRGARIAGLGIRGMMSLLLARHNCPWRWR